ncbi:hypothetical protein BD769DRAFT_1382180 [Suillus cothurnatus]|nr:hypothetical protein BD769DRAFT_1382180 [Suillus cothurnatus]
MSRKWQYWIQSDYHIWFWWGLKTYHEGLARVNGRSVEVQNSVVGTWCTPLAKGNPMLTFFNATSSTVCGPHDSVRPLHLARKYSHNCAPNAQHPTIAVQVLDWLRQTTVASGMVFESSHDSDTGPSYHIRDSTFWKGFGVPGPAPSPHVRVIYYNHRICDYQFWNLRASKSNQISLIVMLRMWSLRLLLTPMSHYAPFATTQLSWIEDMIAHVQADRVSEFSTSGSGDDTSVFWEPDLSSFADPFATYSPTDSTISPPPSSLENFPTLPSSPIGSPSAQLLMRLGDTDVLHEIKISISATDSTNEKKRSCTSCTRHRGAILEQSQNFNPSNDNIVDARIGQPDKQKENKSTTYKRKIEDIGSNTNRKNFDISLNPAPVETRKHICWEKTGTDWQTVFDIIKYGEQQSRQSQMEGTKANI